MGLVPAELVHPLSKTGQGGGERGDAEGGGLQRRVAPRLVVGREQGRVKAYEKVIVGHIEHPVVAVEIAGNEIDLDMVRREIVQAKLCKPSSDPVPVGVHQDMGGPCGVGRVAAAFQLRQQRLVRSPVRAGDHYEGMHLSPLIFFLLQEPESVDKHVQTLVAILVAPTDPHEHGIGGDLLS